MGLRRSLGIALLTLGALAAAGAVSASAGGRPFATSLDGAAEVPGPGDPDATGSASFTLNQGQGTVCFELSWQDVDGEVFAAHIHRGGADVAGPIVVPLFAGSFGGTDAVSGCVAGVDEGLIKEIRQDPDAFYVNVHSLPSFGPGAVRGQLGK